jgi:alpha-1,3-glucosyltransferase
MVQVYNLNYESWQTVYFQRATVIITELVLVYALHLSVPPLLFPHCDLS